MKWKDKLINHFISELNSDSKWSNTIEKILIDPAIGIHLAVFNEPYLSLILNGEKKIESRFSINRISPFMRIAKGDVVILKESGGFVTGAFVAGDVFFYNNLNKNTLREIEKKYGSFICSGYDKNFWKSRERTKYASLIEVKKIKKLIPFKTEKRDMSGWSILREGYSNTLFDLK